MATGFPVKANYATGDVLTAANMNDLSGTVNYLQYMPPRNFLLNSNCSVWQRGTSFSIGAFAPTYTTDRWYMFVATGSNTVTQETTTVPAGNRYATKWTSGAAGGSFAMYQIIETANAQFLAGKTVTLQVQATGTTGKNVQVLLDYSTTVDNTAGASWTAIGGSSISSTVTAGTFSTITYTATIPSTAKTVRFGVGSNSSFANTEYVIWANAQLELGSVANTYMPNQPTYQGELAACQRYYWRNTGGLYMRLGLGIGATTTNAQIVIQNPVTMRTVPTSLEYSNLGLYDQVNLTAVTSATIDSGGVTTNNINMVVASGLTQYRPYTAYLSSSSGYLGLSAEL